VLNIWENFVIVLIAVALSLLFMWVLNRMWPWEQRHAHNDVIGWQLSILGTTYAVILGFMLYTVWTNFGAAELNVENEANAVANLYHLAHRLPKAQAERVEALTRSYGQAVIDQDWPEMAEARVPEASYALNDEMWKVLMSIETASPTEITAEDHALYELSTLSQHRRTRILQSASRLPNVLWCLLIVGGTVTIASSSMFGSANTILHALQVFVFSLLVVLALVAVADIDRPFQGSVHISDLAFHRALQGMK
jgi:hypothetical protein